MILLSFVGKKYISERIDHNIFCDVFVRNYRKRGTTSTDLAAEHPLPSFHKLVNFPEFLPQKSSSDSQNSDDEYKQNKGSSNSKIKHCVMCGTSCLFIGAKTSRSSSARGDNSASPLSSPAASPSSTKSSSSVAPFIIPRQNKGLCTSCDVKVWLVRDLNLTIKWCKGCKNFRPWSAFGEKSRATKCLRCRERQKEKYAAQKEKLKLKRKIDICEKVVSSLAVEASDGEENSRTSADTFAQSQDYELKNPCGESCSEEPSALMDAALGLSKMMNQPSECR